MKNFYKNEKGFSLVEFIVILTIFSIMTSVSLFNYNKHQSILEESNLAQDIALTIRQAQVYGISATNQIYGSEDFDASGYLDIQLGEGVNVIKDQSIRGVSINLDKKTLVLYADNDKNHIFNGENDRVIDERRIISNTIAFDKISIQEDNDAVIEKVNGILDITFQRPYPDAWFAYRSDENSTSGPIYRRQVAIYFKNQKTQELLDDVIEINSIGNISVKKKNHNE